MAARPTSHQKTAEFGDDRIEAAYGIDQPGTQRFLAEIDAGLGGTHRIGIEPTHRSDVSHEQAVETIDFGLESGMGIRAELFVGREIVFLLSRRDWGVAITLLGIAGGREE